MMKTDSNRLCRREFLTKASQVTVAAAALGSAPLPVLAGTETSPRGPPGFRITATARFMSTRSASRKASR